MIRVWRLSQKKYSLTPLNGEGARLRGGRWNPIGTPVVYTSSTLALAQLELLVHSGRKYPLEEFLSFEINIPDSITMQILDITKLPNNWRSSPSDPKLTQIGTEWITAKSSIMLKVPSAVIEGEYNYLINPIHEDFTKISIINSKPITFDPRLFN